MHLIHWNVSANKAVNSLEWFSEKALNSLQCLGKTHKIQSVQSRGGHCPYPPFFIKWSLAKTRVG